MRLRRGLSERWIRETLARVDRPGPSGTATLRRILRACPTGPARCPGSWFERFVERLLASTVLPPPMRQHRVAETDGARVAYLDLAWPEVGLAVEPSGAKGHAGDRRTGAEIMRATSGSRLTAGRCSTRCGPIAGHQLVAVERLLPVRREGVSPRAPASALVPSTSSSVERWRSRREGAATLPDR